MSDYPIIACICIQISGMNVYNGDFKDENKHTMIFVQNEHYCVTQAHFTEKKMNLTF